MPFSRPGSGSGTAPGMISSHSSMRSFQSNTSSTGGGMQSMDMDSEAVSHVWIPDSQTVWCLARLDRLSKDTATVHVPGVYEQAFQVPRKDTRVWDPSHSLYLEDAAKLNALHEAALLSLLHTRFCNDDIYTYTGDVLISVNPYKTIPLLYQMPYDTQTAIHRRVTSGNGRMSDSNRIIQEDAARGNEDMDGLLLDDLEDNPAPKTDSVLDHPHVYSVADKAHRYMTDPQSNHNVRCRDQSIIITGESGAGKTEAAKYVMKYLIAASQAVASPGEEEDSVAQDMEQGLLESTVVLEAFGNAKTVRNDNSSRFGKYIKLQYSSSWRLCGARTLPFLLEKSRLVHQEKDERNYHVFYQLCKGLSDHHRSELKLGDASQYEMLCHGGTLTQSDDVDDAEEFYTLNAALAVLGVAEDDRKGLWNLLAALLHLGNITLVDMEDGIGQGSTSVHLDSQNMPINDLADMVGLPGGLLMSSIRTKKAVTGRGSWLEIPLNATQAKDNLHALVKHIYGQVFTWLVGQINTAHGKTREACPVAFIGILDIFGFEIMARNSFEQLCINFANEVLQQQFNSHVFVLEQQEYEREGLDWTVIQFKDNQPVIDLIAKKPKGLLIQLEEQGMLGRKANNKALLQARLYHNTHMDNEFYSKPRFDSMDFIVKHFAGEVIYDVEGFLEKNNDSLHDNLLDLLDATSDEFLRGIIEFADAQRSDHQGQLQPVGFFPHTPPKAGAGAGLAGDAAMFNPPMSPLSPMARGGGTPSPTPLSPGPGSGAQFSFQSDLSPGSRNASHRRFGDRQENKLARNAASAAKNRVSQIATTVTVSRAFRGQLLSLMATLRATEPHYIKCIKPNNVKAPGGFSSHLVHQQLNYSGVLEVVRIRREAYPGRVPFLEFYERFELLHKRLVAAAAAGTLEVEGGSGQVCLSPKAGTRAQGRINVQNRKKLMVNPIMKAWQEDLPGPGAATEGQGKEASMRVLKAFVPDTCYQIGHTRVFLKEEGQDILRGAVRGVYHRMAALIQATVRAWLGSVMHARKKEAALIIHSAARMYILRKRFTNALAKVVYIQRWYRARTIRHRYKGCILSTIKIQACVRGMLGRKRLKREHEAATTIQRVVRGMQARRWAEELRTELRYMEEEFRRQEWEAQRAWAAGRIRDWFISLIQKYGRKAQERAAIKIQRWVRRRMRVLHLRAEITRAFQHAREGDVNALAHVIRGNPSILFVRNRADRFKTLLHAAATSGSTSLTSLLDPLPGDIINIDADGNTALHLAAASCKYEVVKFLASKANNKVHVPGGVASKTSSVEAQMRETRVTKRISVRIIQEARNAVGKACIRTGGVIASAKKVMDVSASTSAQASKPVFQGILLKRRETGLWQRRWCVLTERDMEYYRSRQDFLKGKKPSKTVELSSALLKKSVPTSMNSTSADRRHCFELHSGALLGDKRNREGRLYFKAKTEEELYSWLVPLRVLVGSHNLIRTGGVGVVRYLDVARRHELVNAKNKAGETPLFFTAKDLGQPRTEANSIARVQIATWLVENGCDVNVANNSGKTTIHEALLAGQIPLAAALVRKGGDLGIKDHLGRSCLDLVMGEQEMESITVGHFQAAEKNPMLPPPMRLSKMTYLNFHLEKLVMQTTAGLDSPFITISVYDNRGRLLEAPQDVTAPVVNRSNYLWWSTTYHMQNPIENLDPGSFIIFLLRNQNTAIGTVRDMGWAVFQINPNTVNTQELSMEMYKAPVDLFLRKLQPADLFLSGDIHLTTAQVDLDRNRD